MLIKHLGALVRTSTYKYLKMCGRKYLYYQNIWRDLTGSMCQPVAFHSEPEFQSRPRISPTGKLLDWPRQLKNLLKPAGRGLWCGQVFCGWGPRLRLLLLSGGRNFHRRTRRTSSNNTDTRLTQALVWPQHTNTRTSFIIRVPFEPLLTLFAWVGLHQASLRCIIFLCW
jgi:hypothetical protein